VKVHKKNSIKALSKETLITREQGSGTRITIERVLGMKFNDRLRVR
jgi:molybdate-binding protein